MENNNIDMEAIARWSGIRLVCPDDILEPAVMEQRDKCSQGDAVHDISACEVCHHPEFAPNFRDPEWLGKLIGYVVDNGHHVGINITGGSRKVEIWTAKANVYSAVADNWIDAFLLAVTKLAKEV